MAQSQRVADHAHGRERHGGSGDDRREQNPEQRVENAGGDRDAGKRPQMGAIAARGADRAWITNDNPRSEDPESIADQIEAGASGAPAGRMSRLLDRRAAIAAALAEGKRGDVVLIAGKGHETTQTIGDQVLPFDDRQVARELLGGRS